MATSSKILTAFCLLAGTALACSLTLDLGTQPPANATPSLSGLDRVSTMVAQTLQVFTKQAPTVTPTPTPTAIPTATTVPTFAPPPVLTVSQATRCRTGPGTTYGIVTTLNPGTIATLVAKDTPVNYWVINTPNYPGSTCWLPGDYATVSGDTSLLPEVSAPAVSAYTLSEAKALNISCTSQTVTTGHDSHEASIWTVFFRWKNTEPNQTGVRVFRDGRQIATLGAHATSFEDEFRHFHHRSAVTYGVQAFNRTAVSSIVTIEVRHCSD